MKITGERYLQENIISSPAVAASSHANNSSKELEQHQGKIQLFLARHNNSCIPIVDLEILLTSSSL